MHKLQMKEYIKNCHGFKEENITVLMDDNKHTSPTKANILAAYKKIVADTQSGDVVFCHYSGHGGKVRDQDGDEKDGYDEVSVLPSCCSIVSYDTLSLCWFVAHECPPVSNEFYFHLSSRSTDPHVSSLFSAFVVILTYIYGSLTQCFLLPLQPPRLPKRRTDSR